MALKKKPVLILACHLSLIILVGILAYVPAFQVPFTFDDHRNVADNPAIRDIQDIAAIWNYNPSRFVVLLTFAANHAIDGQEVWGFHLANLVVHVTNACLVYLLAGLLLTLSRGSNTAVTPGQCRTLCLWAGLVFVSHPLQTQAVTLIWQRNASLSALLYLLSLVLYTRAGLSRMQATRAYKSVLVISWLTTVLAMFSKQNAVTLPLAILFIEFTFFTPVKQWRIALRRILPFLATICIVPILVFALHNPELRDVHMIEQRMLAPGAYFLTQLHVLRSYLRLFFIPINQNLDYDYPPTFVPGITTLASLVLLAAVLAFGLMQFNRRKLVFFGTCFFFLALVVESSFFPLEDVIYEHRLYLPMTGLILALVGLVSCVPVRLLRTRGIALLFLVIPCLAFATFNRNQTWLSRETLWEDVIAKSPHKPRGYNNLGQFYQDEGQQERSKSYFLKMLKLDPFYHYEAHLHLGWAFQEQSNLPKARYHYEESLKLNSAQPKALYNLGLVHYDEGEFRIAAKYFHEALKFSPDNVGFRYQLAASDYFMGLFDQAVEELNKCLQIDPIAVECHFLMGLTLFEQKEYENAIASFKRVLELHAQQGRAHFFLARTYRKLDSLELANAELEAAKRLGFEIPEEFRGEFSE